MVLLITSKDEAMQQDSPEHFGSLHEDQFDDGRNQIRDTERS